VYGKSSRLDTLPPLYFSFKCDRREGVRLNGFYTRFKNAKIEIQQRLTTLNDSLNTFLAKTYGILDKEKIITIEIKEGKDTIKKKVNQYKHWLQTHQPFHWLAEYYEIIVKRSGFDVVIGNPPYVEYKDVKGIYTLKWYDTINAGDLYSFVMERSFMISNAGSKLGFIIPMSCFSVDGFYVTQQFLTKRASSIYITNWSGDAHPSKLFEGVDKRLNILLMSKCGAEKKLYTSRYYKWYASEREYLFETRSEYTQVNNATDFYFESSVPKLSTDIEKRVLKKIKSFPKLLFLLSETNPKEVIYYTRKVSFFLQFLSFVPNVKNELGNSREPSELKELFFENVNQRNLCLLALNSSLFYWFYIVNSDCRNLNKREIVSFPIPGNRDFDYPLLKKMVERLMKDYKNNSFERTVYYKGKGEKITVQYFNFRPSKPIIDEIDLLLAKYYDFTEEELDFIINYDVKYRLGLGKMSTEDEELEV